MQQKLADTRSKRRSPVIPIMEKEMATHSSTLAWKVFLPGESQGRGSLVGCRLWGHTELDTTEAT